jgi:hypothetical protein
MNRLHICDFLTIKEYLTCGEYIVLVNTSKNFKFIKKYTVYYRLNIEYSNKYYFSNNFRYNIHKNIHNPLLQISLVFLFNNNIFNCERLMTHTVILIYCPKIVNIFPLCHSNTVIIYGCNGIKNIIPLLLNSHVQNLQIKSCSGLKLPPQGLIISN